MHAPDVAARDLVGAVRSGDRHALAQLVALYAPRVERAVRTHLGSFLRERTETEDVAQAVLLEVCRDVGRLEVRTEAQLVAWLNRLVRNEIINLAKHHTAEMRDAGELSLHELASDDSGAHWEPPSRSPGALERLFADELRGALGRCLADLPESSRRVLYLRINAGMEWQQVAQELGKSNCAAAQQLFQRARRKLLACIPQHLRKQ